MSWEDVLKIVTATIASVGVGGALVLALSSFIGKIWAARILENEKHQLLEKLEQTKSELHFIKETTLRFQNDKLATYRLVVENTLGYRFALFGKA
jgi:hypothetical protein